VTGISPHEGPGAAARDPVDLSREVIEVEREQEPDGLVSYAAKFGLKLEDLTVEQAMILVAARGVEKHVKGLKIPMSERSVDTGKKIVVEKEEERVIEKTTYREGEKPSPIPADRMDLTTLEGPEQLPEILPGEWLVEEVAPDIFLKKLREQTLLRRQWRETTRTPVTSHETVKEKVLVEEPAPPEVQKQHACVLLDVSGSMVESYDGRNVVGAGLALAFLLHGFEQRARLSLRLFNGTVFALSQGTSFEDLKRMARQILNIRWGGGTDIQDALRVATEDIRGGGSFTRADILLISDGLSWLGENPLGDIKLHTFLLALSPRQMLESESLKALVTLRSWSTTLKSFGTSKFAGIMLPSKKDLDEIEKSIRSIPDRLKDIASDEEREQLIERASNLNRLLKKLMEIAGEVEGHRPLLEKLRGSIARRRLQGILDELEEIMRKLQMLGPEVLEENKERKEQEARVVEEQEKAEDAKRRQQHAEKEAQAARELEAMLSKLREADIPDLEPQPGEGGSPGEGTEGPGRSTGSRGAGGPGAPQQSETPEEQRRRLSLWQRLRRWLREQSLKLQEPPSLPPEDASKFPGYRLYH